MASRLTGRREVLVPRIDRPRAARGDPHLLRPPRLARQIEVELVDHDPATGRRRPGRSRAKLSGATAAVYFENPSFLGGDRGRRRRDRCARARRTAPRRSSGVDPISLGVLAPPARLRRRHRRRHDPAARRAHELRRRRRAASSPPATRSATRASTRRSMLSICDTIVAGRARVRHRALRPDVVRHARGGQRLDGQLGLPVGDRERRRTCRCSGRTASPSSAS